MPDFDYTAWGNSQIGRWVLEDGSSGIYRGQCTQMVSQLLKDIGFAGWQRARGDGKNVGDNMVAHGEAEYVGTDLASVPAGEIHVVSSGFSGLYGHVMVAGAGDVVYETNVNNGGGTRNYGAGPTYSARLGRLGEAWRGTKKHYRITVDGDYDNIVNDGPIGDTGGGYIRGDNQDIQAGIYNHIQVKKFKSNPDSSVKNRKKYFPVAYHRNK